MSTYQDRAREVINLVTYYYHQAEVSKMKGVLTDAECVEAQEKYKDQALSELASIVEEDLLKPRLKNLAPNTGAAREVKDIIRSLHEKTT